MTNGVSPCMHCTRVKEPQNCENKSCRPWREWFIAQWEQTRRLYRKGMDHTTKKQGVPLGGQRYCSPHRVAEYLHTDPCDVCKLPRELCSKPCKQKIQWEQVQKEVANELESRSHR